MNRNAQSQHVAATPQSGSSSASVSSAPKKPQSDNEPAPKWMQWFRGAILVLGVLMLLAIVGLLATSRPESQAKFVMKDKLQAVFLNNGQVYFGNINAINAQYFVLSNIYYLQTQESVNGTKAAASSNISLIKLGCELHQPYDQMIVNRDQVTFWENLKDDGQVANKIKEFKDKNPSGQKCDQSAAPSNTNVQGNNAGTGNNTQGDTGDKTPAPTTPTTPTTKP